MERQLSDAGRRSRVEDQSRHGIGIKDCESLQWLQEYLGGVGPFLLVRTMRTGDELAAPATRHVGFENLIRVVEVRKNDVEP